jgi:hypothetical protein
VRDLAVVQDARLPLVLAVAAAHAQKPVETPFVKQTNFQHGALETHFGVWRLTHSRVALPKLGCR